MGAVRNLFQLVPSRGLNTKRELIYTHGINNSIQSIICSAELKTAIVSPMDCVDSSGASHINMLHRAASNPIIHLVHSWVLCGRCCTHSYPPRTIRVRRIGDRYTGRPGRHTRCPSSRCSTGSAPWCTARYRCTGRGRRLWRDREWIFKIAKMSEYNWFWYYFCKADVKLSSIMSQLRYIAAVFHY